jgi:hypothetical protein
MNTLLKLMRPLLLVFIGITVAVFAADGIIQTYQLNKNTLLAANMMLLVLFLLVLLLQKNALQHKNPNVWVRSVMLGMTIKMLLCAISVVVYIKYMGEGINRRSVYVALIFYLIYLFVEVKTITKLNPGKNA